MADNIQSFQWLGIDPQGKRVKGTLNVADIKEAQAELARQSIAVTSLKPTRTKQKKRAKVKTKSILLFTRYLSTMLTSGLPILQALDIIAQDQDNAPMQSFVIALRTNIAGGKTLAESFAQYPDYFSDLYTNLIKAGEKSGALDKILKRLANYLERTETLKAKIKKAMIYPASIITIALGVSSIMLIFVVPKFESMFQSVGAQLPGFTRMIVSLSKFLQSYWWLIIVVGVGSVWLIKRALKNSPKFRFQFDVMTLRIWLIGGVLRKGIIARYTRTLSTTLEAGMPITESLTAMINLMGNVQYAQAVEKIRDDVVSGHPLSASMTATKLFPNMVVQMIAVGEASGSLSEMLNKVADYYEEEVNNIVDSLSSLMEPLIMVVMGVVIGGLVIAMYLPIFKMGSIF